MRIVEKPSFLVCGKKIWISGQRNEEFADFWAGTHGSGLIDRLRRLTGPIVMEKSLLGISRVEKDLNSTPIVGQYDILNNKRGA